MLPKRPTIKFVGLLQLQLQIILNKHPANVFFVMKPLLLHIFKGVPEQFLRRRTTVLKQCSHRVLVAVDECTE